MAHLSTPPPIKMVIKPSAALVLVTTGLVVVNGLRGFVEGWVRSHQTSYALGSATFCVLFPSVVALFFSVGKKFRNVRSLTKVVLWTTVIMLLAGAANLAQQAAVPRLSPRDATSKPSTRDQSASSIIYKPVSPDADAERLAQVFPKLYWYACDAYLRENTRHGLGFPQKEDEFVRKNKAVIEKCEKVENRGIKWYKVRLRLHDPKSPKEYWVLEFTLQGNSWEPQTGYKYADGKRAFDLFENESFAGIEGMGSMKPYFEKLLTAYSEGQDLNSVFVEGQQFQNQPSDFGTRQLVGRWRHVDPIGKLVTEITFREDGTYAGSVEVDGNAKRSFSGKWVVKDGILSYEYTASSDNSIPVGTKDQDKFVELTKDRYIIRNALGLRETYVRVE